jgi:hypothetical protein
VWQFPQVTISDSVPGEFDIRISAPPRLRFFVEITTNLYTPDGALQLHGRSVHGAKINLKHIDFIALSPHSAAFYAVGGRLAR